MKKNSKFNLSRSLFSLIMCVLLTVGVGVSVSAEEIGESPEISEVGGEVDTILPDNNDSGGESEENIFEEIYAVIEANADKIFSVLAFIGTLVVSVGYKSGLIPLLNDALSKLKDAVDGVRENGEKLNNDTTGKIAEIERAIKSMEGEIENISTQVGAYEDMRLERQSLRTLVEGQIDMLYAIFMSSSLPQYQKDEVGMKIQSMREELASYEKTAE